MNGATPIQFTIITPSLNYARYIRECLDSVKNQEGVSFEHLVFDAGSTDGTIKILREYPHIALTVEPDRGMADAINKGFRKARGEWIMWLNSDDRLLPGALKSVWDFASEHPEADVIHGAWNFIDADGRFKRAMKAIPFRLSILVGYGCYIASTALFLRRRTTIGEGFLLDDRFRCVMDGEYYARLGRAGKVFCNYNRPLAEFRQHEDSLSSLRLSKLGIDDWLRREQNRAESVAIRRAYGFSPFRTDRWNGVSDAFLAEFHRLRKGLLGKLTPWEK